MTMEVNRKIEHTDLVSSGESAARRSATPSAFASDEPQRAPSPFLRPSLDGTVKPAPHAQPLDMFIPEEPQSPQGAKWQPSRRSSSAFKRPDLVELKRSRSPQERLEALKKLVIDKLDYINGSKADGKTVLHLTAEAGHLQFLKFLVELDEVKLDVLSIKGETPLHLAVKNPECVRILLSRSISKVDSLNYKGYSPLHLAARAAKSDSIYLLIILGKANVEIRTEKGRTALHIAARIGDLNSVKALVEAGKADLETTDHEGNTPLLMAALCGRKRCVRFLVKAKANVYAENMEGVSFKQLSEKHSQYAEIFEKRPQA